MSDTKQLTEAEARAKVGEAVNELGQRMSHYHEERQDKRRWPNEAPPPSEGPVLRAREHLGTMLDVYRGSVETEAFEAARAALNHFRDESRLPSPETFVSRCRHELRSARER